MRFQFYISNQDLGPDGADVNSLKFKLFGVLAEKNLVIKWIFLFIYISSSSFAYAKPHTLNNSESILLNPRLASPYKFLLSHDDYQDIRIDSNKDGKTDFWILKKGSLQINTRFDAKGRLSFIHLKKILKDDVIEAVYVPSGAKLKLLASGKRKVALMHGSAEDVCISAKKNLVKDLSSLNLELSRRAVAANVDGLFDEKCPDMPFYEQSVQSLISLTAENQGADSFSSCMESDSFKANLTEDQKLSVDVLASQLRLNLARIANGTNSPKVKISCEILNDQKDKVSGAFSESGNLVIQAPQDSQKIGLATFKRVFLHEFIHQAGSPSDEFVEAALDKCFNKNLETMKIGPIKASSDGANFFPSKQVEKVVQSERSLAHVSMNVESAQITQAPVTLDQAKKSVNGGSISPEIDMANEVAISQPLPSGEALAVASMDKSPEGLSSSLEASSSQSAPMLRMANQAMGALNEPAVASSASLASFDGETSSNELANSSTSRSQSRTIASESAPKIGIVQRNGLKSDERVVEQIEVGSSSSEVATSSANTAASGSSTAAKPEVSKTSSRAPASVAKSPSAAASAEVAAMGSTSSSVSPVSMTTPTNSVSGAINPVSQSTSATNRKPSSVAASSASSSNDSSTGRDEVVTFFSRGDYSMTKNKLKDQGFVDKLKDNKVTIVDLYGNSFGASKGDVIFLDEGNRFVRQK